ncbi:MAG: cbb3-type cytochrome c oxidase subunit I [gamma proteobacterium symbiont of Bathyaustriella thionipta]|nr:cbb3-type cytochrome c oxidase subunit I [gamma proteobacterium symbiont of Bathyaustriella thionipta]
MKNYDKATGLSMANMWIAFIFFLVAAFLGLFQVVERAGLIPELETPVLYFASVSTHGVLMGFVLTTFFVMGFGYYCATTSLKQSVWNKGLAWFGFFLSLSGVLMAAYPLLTGQASVLYTFYPPLGAHPLFYIGATLLVVGSWVWCLQMIMMMHVWKKAHPGEAVPLIMFGTTANATLWLWTSAGVASEILFQLIPWSLGYIETIDVGLSRTLFSWTLHAIVYFWLFPAYLALYTLVPKAAGGRLFSDEMGRIAFVMLLVFSVPIGFHHLYMDPFQSAGFKFLHMLGTFMVMVPTLLTGFTVIASLEISGRLRGGKGLFGWIGALPWKDPLVLSAGLALLMLTVGGFGGAINASYAMNTLIHNTQWVTGHFHLIFAGTVVILYMGVAYHIWPKMTGRQLASAGLARMQLWLWFWGMLVLTLPWHVLGLLGQPRRISSTPYDSPLVQQWFPYEVAMAVGGVILFIAAAMLIWNLFRAQGNNPAEANTEMEYAVPVHPVLHIPKLLNSFAFWNIVVLVYMIASYGYPIIQFFMMDTHGTTLWGVLKMKLIYTSLALLAVAICGQALAEPSSEVAFDKETRALLKSGDIERGFTIAKKKKCGRCHGGQAPGLSDDTEQPNLAGQMASYTFKQLMDYRSKHRSSRKMSKRAKHLKVQDIADISQYYASLDAAPSSGIAVDPAITRLVYKGDPKRMINPCATCHGRKGEGGKHDSAALTGQRRSYFINTMASFQEEDRSNDIYSRMRLIAEELTEEEIEGLADFYASTDPDNEDEEE